MDANNNVKIPNCKQLEGLVALMKKNVKLAKGYFCFGHTKTEYNERWNGLASKLNDLGPPIKKGSEWQRVWINYQNKIKKKLAHNKNDISETGDRWNSPNVFSPLEESVINLLNLETICSMSTRNYVLTQNPTVSQTENRSVKKPTVNVHIIDDEGVAWRKKSQININKKSEIIDSLPPRKRRKTNTNIFEDDRNRLLKILTRNTEETAKNTKDCARYTRKLSEIKERKFNMWKEIQFDKKKFREDNLEYKIKSLDYKRRKLTLQNK